MNQKTTLSHGGEVSNIAACFFTFKDGWRVIFLTALSTIVDRQKANILFFIQIYQGIWFSQKLCK